MNDQDKNIILFDGTCNFCNSWINFIIKHDKKNSFRFATLQSEAAKCFSEKIKGLNAVIYIEDSILYTKSTAILRILKKLSGIYSLAYIFIIIPAFIRNAVYNIFARNRYKWFRKKESCIVPTSEMRARFLD